jgi:hypothetical protein
MLLLSLRETIKESDGESVVIGIPADVDNIPAIRSGSFNLMSAFKRQESKNQMEKVSSSEYLQT